MEIEHYIDRVQDICEDYHDNATQRHELRLVLLDFRLGVLKEVSEIGKPRPEPLGTFTRDTGIVP